MFNKIVIEYCKKDDIADSYSVEFDLCKNNFVPKWVQAVLDAQKMYQIDDPGRFYGFFDLHKEENIALERIQNCIRDINEECNIIDRMINSPYDQDTLNYLHSIFEKYHGLLDQQCSKFWEDASENLRKNLANLNLLVHRCESLKSNDKRHVVTYFGLPKDRYLDESDYDLFTDEISAGDITINYVEIGKTLKDLALDNDSYISDEAFKPFEHYSADFVVHFTTRDQNLLNYTRQVTNDYYEKHKSFFGPWKKKFSNGSIVVAKASSFDINEISKRQYVKRVYFI